MQFTDNVLTGLTDGKFGRVDRVISGNQLKTPYRDGTNHVIVPPLDFIARLAALVPKTRVNLIPV